MMRPTAAKRKTFWLVLIASALALCPLASASSHSVRPLKSRAEVSAENGRNGVGRLSLTAGIASSYYDALAEAASDSSVAPRGLVDPHLDANLLIAAADPANVNHSAAIAFLRTNQSAGLSASQTALREFLVKAPTPDAFKLLQRTYGIKLVRDIPQGQIKTLASRFQAAFTDGRKLGAADARIAAEAFLRGEKLGTGDLAFFKRARDLGLPIEFAGSDASALSKAANYIPKPVTP